MVTAQEIYESECHHELGWLCNQDGEHHNAFDVSALQMDVSAIMSETRQGGAYNRRAQVVIASINQVWANLYPEATDPCMCGHAFLSHERTSAQCFVMTGPHGTELGPAMCDCMSYTSR